MRGTFTVALVAAIALAVPMAAPVSAQEAVTAFVNVSVLPMDRERVLAGQTVLVRGTRITELGPTARIRVPPEAVRVDGRGKFLIPGLGDMHAHLREQRGTTSPIAQSLLLYVANGVTTVRDLHSGGVNSDQLALRQQVASGQLLGPRIYTTGDPSEGAFVKATRLQAPVADLKAAGHDFVKIYARPDDPSFDTLMAAAARVQLRVAGHVPDSIGVEGVLKARWASIEHLTGYFGYMIRDLQVPYRKKLLEDKGDELELARWKDKQAGISASDTTPAGQPWWTKPKYQLDPVKLRRIAEATKQAGVWNTPTLHAGHSTHPLWRRRSKGEDYQTADPEWQVKAKASLYPHFQIVKALHDAGAGLLLGSDAMLPGFPIRRELETLVLAGLTPYQALETGTRNIAVFLGTLDSTGTIAPGKRADLVLLEGNPLQDISYVAGPAGVMVGGRWLARAELDARLDSIPTYHDMIPSTNVRTWDLKELRRLEWPRRAQSLEGR